MLCKCIGRRAAEDVGTWFGFTGAASAGPAMPVPSVLSARGTRALPLMPTRGGCTPGTERNAYLLVMRGWSK